MNGAITNSSLYRAVWRWHFYAGLLVLPFLVLLAVTGGAYLFKPELDHAVYHGMMDVRARSQSVPVSVTIANVEAALDGRVQQIILPDREDRALQFTVRMPNGDARTAYADPHDGRFLGSTSYGGVMQLVRKLHSLQQFGFWASCLIEVAAGWAIILAGTGIFLWWPRGSGAGVVSVRGTPKTRAFWRDLHAITGSFAALVIIFLAVTGMPWSMFWGEHVQNWATAAHLNRPAPPANVTPAWMLSASMPGMNATPRAHDQHRDHMNMQMPWAVERTPMPMSSAAHDIGIDAVIARFEALGVKRPFGLQPAENGGPYVATFTPDQAERERTVYLSADGALLRDIGFAQYGPIAKAVEWGIMVHQGQQYGAINRYLMLAGCIAILVLSVSAIMMWWKRRPPGSLGAPPRPQSPAAALTVLAVIVVVATIYPLVGVSLIAALLIDSVVAQPRS